MNQTIWNNYKVNKCPRCNTIILEDELDFCYPTNLNRSIWEAGCPFCNLYIEGVTMDDAIMKWNSIDEGYITEFKIVEEEFNKRNLT